MDSGGAVGSAEVVRNQRVEQSKPLASIVRLPCVSWPLLLAASRASGPNPDSPEATENLPRVPQIGGAAHEPS